MTHCYYYITKISELRYYFNLLIVFRHTHTELLNMLNELKSLFINIKGYVPMPFCYKAV